MQVWYPLTPALVDIATDTKGLQYNEVLIGSYKGFPLEAMDS